MLRRQLAKVTSGDGGRSRHDAIRAAASCMGHYVAAGAIGEAQVSAEIEAVAATLLDGGRMGEVRRLIRSGIDKGDASKATFGSASAFSGADRTIVVPWRGQSIRISRERGVSVIATLPSGTIPAAHAVATPTIRITLFAHAFERQGSVEEMTWEGFAAMIGEPEEWPQSGDKRELPMFTSAEIEDDNRGKRPSGIDDHGHARERSPYCSAVHALVLDYDDDPEWSIEQVHRWWSPLQYVAYTTSSHLVEKVTTSGKAKPPGPRGRVVVALSRPVTPEEYARLGQWVLAADKGAPGLSELGSSLRGYFVPTKAPGGYESRANLTGIGLDVDAVLSAAAEIDDAADAADQRLAYSTTPDGRPYLVKITGSASWYVATADSYALVDEPLIRAELGRHWPELPTSVPAQDPERPPKPMGPSALFTAYGVRAESVVYTYTGSTRFRPGAGHTGELRIRCIGAPQVRPARHPDVLEWLSLLTGPQYDTVLDWLATMPQLDRPTAALLLIGDNTMGKSMIATGSARYFGASVTDYDDIFKGRFNDALLRSPIVFLDEGTQQESRSAGFRKLIANSNHAVEGKNRPSATLEGCPRLIVAANNPDPLRLSREELSAADEDAIGERILMIRCSAAAGLWLKEHGQFAATHDWVTRGEDEPGKIPETIEWLRQNRTVKPGGRFLVRGDAAEWAALAGTRTGHPSTILDAIATWLNDPHLQAELRRNGAEPFVIHPEHPDAILVSNIRLRAAWDALLRDRPPNHIQVSKALERLSGGTMRQVTLDNGRRVRLSAVPRALLGDRVEG